MKSLTCFKAYDIRGKLGEVLNDDVAYRVGRAFAKYLNAKCVADGGDVHKTSDTLKSATLLISEWWALKKFALRPHTGRGWRNYCDNLS